MAALATAVRFFNFTPVSKEASLWLGVSTKMRRSRLAGSVWAGAGFKMTRRPTVTANAAAASTVFLGSLQLLAPGPRWHHKTRGVPFPKSAGDNLRRLNQPRQRCCFSPASSTVENQRDARRSLISSRMR